MAAPDFLRDHGPLLGRIAAIAFHSVERRGVLVLEQRPKLRITWHRGPLCMIDIRDRVRPRAVSTRCRQGTFTANRRKFASCTVGRQAAIQAALRSVAAFQLSTEADVNTHSREKKRRV